MDPKFLGYTKPSLNAALQLRGIPAGAKLIPCPAPLPCGCRPPGAVDDTCHTYKGPVVRPGSSLHLVGVVVVCFTCLHAALIDAKKMAGAPQ